MEIKPSTFREGISGPENLSGIFSRPSKSSKQPLLVLAGIVSFSLNLFFKFVAVPILFFPLMLLLGALMIFRRGAAKSGGTPDRISHRPFDAISVVPLAIAPSFLTNFCLSGSKNLPELTLFHDDPGYQWVNVK